MAKCGPSAKALFSMGQNSLVCLLAGWFMVMKSLQWEERKSLGKFLSYSPLDSLEGRTAVIVIFAQYI